MKFYIHDFTFTFECHDQCLKINQLDNQVSYSDTDLLAGFLNKEEKALEQLHARLYGQLCYFAEKLVLNRQAAEEIVIDVFVKIWKSHTPFTTYAHLRAYLFEAVKNESLNVLKREGRYAKHLRQYGDMIDLNIANFENEQLETAALELIFQIAEELPGECKKIFDLLYKQQLTYQEAANLLHLNVQTVRNQRSRAIAFIRKQLKVRSLLWLLIFLK